jgi:hypothetical protein
MLIWLASYPRSGNTYFRILLHHLFGFHTFHGYPVPGNIESLGGDIKGVMQLMGADVVETKFDVDKLRADSDRHFVKTHDLPSDSSSPAVVLIRDGRDAAVSYAHFVLKTEKGIEHAPSDVFATALEEIITGNRFGGWSRNVEAWINKAGWNSVVRYEDLIKDPVNTVIAAVQRFSISSETKSAAPPSFLQLKAMAPWFFRKGKSGSWQQEMPSRLQELFLQRHGDTLLRLGYSEQVAS